MRNTGRGHHIGVPKVRTRAPSSPPSREPTMTDAVTRAANVEAVRRYRERHPDLVAQSNRDATRRYATSERGRLARMMHARVRRAVRAGRLERLPCGVCGNAKSQGHHHRGYDFPLDVVWLCALHHKEAHRVV